MIVGYLRVSTCKQHLTNQKEEIQRYAATRHISVDCWVTEIVSGKKNEKERKLGPLLRRMKAGDTLIVTEISRLSRTLTDIMNIMGKCLQKKIKLYTTKEGYTFDDTINSKVLCFAFGLVAEIERNLISLRTREALAARKANGAVLGRKAGSCTKRNILMKNKEKVYCMNIEYDFIRDIFMQKENEKLWDRFKYYFNYKRYFSYLFTLGRISKEFKRGYVERISREFKRARSQDELDFKVFTPNTRKKISLLIQKPTVYYWKYVVLAESPAGKIMRRIKKRL